MQKCLNKDYEHYIKCLNNPVYCTGILIILIMAFVFPVVGVYCYTSWNCAQGMIDISLVIGVTLDLFFILFIIIPCSLRIFLNCCYEEIPPPPKTRPPTIAYKSYAESLTKSESKTGRSKSIDYVENPARPRSRSRSKSDSEV